MADAKNPVWVENKWFNGVADDPYVGVDGSFQYSQNLEIRNNLKWFQLSPLEETRVLTSRLNCYLTFSDPSSWPNPPLLLKFYDNGDIVTTDNNWTVETVVATLATPVQSAFSFKTRIYAFGNNVVYEINPTWWVVTDITVALVAVGYEGAYKTVWLNYWNNTFVIGNKNGLITLAPDPTVAVPAFPADYIWERRRSFSEWNEIVAISNSWGNIKVYTSYQYTDSRVFYIPASFDLGFEGINETIEWKGSNVRNIAIIWKTDYTITRGSGLDNVGVINRKLYETSGYDRQLIKTTFDSNGDPNYTSQFVLADNQNWQYPVYEEVAYIPWLDWIRSYGKTTPWIEDSLVKNWNYENRVPISSVIFGDYLYVSFEDLFWLYRERRYYLGYKTPEYTAWVGIMISRVYNGNYLKDIKQAIEIDIGYELEPTSLNPGYIEVYIRPNRISKNIALWWKLIGTITDNTQNRFRAIASNIVQDFNMLEYRFLVFRGDSEVTPIVNEWYLEFNPQIKR